MILKSFEVSKKEISSIKLFLVYGENQGLKKEIIDTIKSKDSGKEIKYEETQILANKLFPNAKGKGAGIPFTISIL